jgi:hypothetical protein
VERSQGEARALPPARIGEEPHDLDLADLIRDGLPRPCGKPAASSSAVSRSIGTVVSSIISSAQKPMPSFGPES